TLHEADVHKAYEVMDEHFALCESKLKRIRKKRGMTQEMLAERSGVSLNTIRSYEQKTKDINKAQIGTLLDIANVLNCEVTELLG
ncbi:MAG: helix-turn-helix transcriptional regulator, partial [Peptococcaceae bacterium]|nr:helix-turn-helix transcriptional regulator [Peptococcaceae bacterium]